MSEREAYWMLYGMLLGGVIACINVSIFLKDNWLVFCPIGAGLSCLAQILYNWKLK